jgi:hypothetical protein
MPPQVKDASPARRFAERGRERERLLPAAMALSVSVS